CAKSSWRDFDRTGIFNAPTGSVAIDLRYSYSRFFLDDSQSRMLPVTRHSVGLKVRSKNA
ncbi:MAG: hypothetical protein WA778_10360, partial [Pseudolabrys sp.]